MKKHSSQSMTVRRSVALPWELVENARETAPAEMRDNVNRIVIVALREFVERRRKARFEDEMARMAQDPAMRAECDAIAREFSTADSDGLPVTSRPRKPRRPIR